MKRFNFLIASERSGSNFLTSLLDGHSKICGPPPTHLFRLFGTNRDKYGDLAREKNWDALVEDMVLNFSCKLGHWNTTVTESQLEAGARERSVAAALAFIYEREAEQDGAEQLFVKENHTHSFAPFLMAHFPDCKFVYLVRDPRDVASSWVKTEGIPGGVEKATDVWVRDQTASLALFHQLRDSGRIRVVHYEDLVRKPTEELEALTGYLGLSYEPEMASFHQRSRTIKNAERIDAWANLSKPVLKGNYGKYRATLSEADIRYVETAAWEIMRFFDYGTDFVDQSPGEDAAEALDALRPALNPGSYTIATAEEREIRERRLAAIDRVLARRL